MKSNPHTTEITSIAWVGEELLTTSRDKTARLGAVVFEGHLKAVNHAVALAKRVVTVSDDCGVRFYDRATGQLLVLAKGHTSRVTKIAVTKSGVVTESDDGSVRHWKRDGTPGKVLRGKTLAPAKKTKPNTELAVVLGKGVRAVAKADGSVALVSGKRTVVLGAHDDVIVALSVSEDGKSLASAAADGSVRVWKWAELWKAAAGTALKPPTLERIWSAKVLGEGANSFWDAGELWVGRNDVLQCLDPKTGKELRRIGAKGEIVHLGPTTAVFADYDKTARVVNRKSGKVDLEIPLNHAYLYPRKPLSWLNESLSILDPEAQSIAKLGPVGEQLCCKAFSLDGKLATGGGNSARAWIWEIATRKLLGEPTWTTNEAHQLDFTHDHTRLVVGTTGGRIFVYNARDGALIHELVSPKTKEARFGWAPIFVSRATDRVVGWGGDQHHAILFDTTTAEPIARLLSDEPDSGYARQGISFSPDGTRVVIAHATRVNLGFYDAMTGERLSKHTSHRPSASGLKFTWLDAKRVLSTTEAHEDKSLRVWNAETGDRIWTNLGVGGKHLGEIVISSTGRFLAVTAWDWASARIIDAQTGVTIADLEHPTGSYVRRPSFSEDDQFVVTTTNGGPANLWRLPT